MVALIILAAIVFGIPVIVGSIVFWWALFPMTRPVQPSPLDDGVYQ